MIVEYLDSAIRQARERARVLKGKIPNPAPIAELAGLQRTCEQHLDNLIGTLDYLATDPAVRNPDSVRERIRLFRRVHEELAILESTGVAALTRQNRDDVFLNRVVFEVHKEVAYPLSPPAVTCLSQHYYAIYPSLGLLSVPLAESHFLLNLPDLYHELAHPLLSTPDNPKLDGFQVAFAQLQDTVASHFRMERSANIRSTGPKEYYAFVLDVFERAWLESWSVELFCDAFATYTLGPAYAWTHLHLVASTKADPTSVRVDRPMSHPPDQARMDVLLHVLAALGRSAEAQQIWEAWAELVDLVGAKRDSLYARGCPDQLVEAAATMAVEGTKRLGCSPVFPNVTGSTPIRGLLNDAWVKFWSAPERYTQWEREQVGALRERLVP